MKAPEWLKPGDRIDATIEELGTLTTYIVAE
jgi:2-keto-4-pentenoate hydratase/2-oxohepta-3-ene-1,7-dioic acid hydratase in catechol pathway